MIENIVLDANVLYSAPVRDILLNLAEQALFYPKWSKRIEEEWIENLLKNRSDLTRKKLEGTINAMNSAFPEANVEEYQNIVEQLELPDPDDRHVLAIAIKSEAKGIVTFNLKDFPVKKLFSEYSIVVRNPDQFILSLAKIDEVSVRQAFNNQLKSLKNPPIPKSRLLEILRKCGLEKSTEIFE